MAGQGVGASEPALTLSTRKDFPMPSNLSRPATGAAMATAAALAAVGADAAPSAPGLEPATQAFVAGLPNGPPIYTLTPTAARGVLSSVQASVRPHLVDAETADRVLPVGPGGATRIRVYRPQGAPGALPVVIYTHGGGWVLGGTDTHDRLVRELAVGAGAVVVFVDYDRSPEARFPTAIEQSYAVMSYVAQHPAAFGADPTRLAIAGDSVGGNMTVAVAMMAKERDGPKIAAQLLFYPVTDASMSTGSYAEFADGPWLTKKAMAWYWDQYLPDPAKRRDPHASPLNATPEQLRGLPRTLLLVDENDVLRDEGEAYGRKLAQAGVPVVSARYNGTIHDFMMLNPLAETPAVRAAVAQTVGYLRTVFSGQ
jgi:acetyl esterase